MRRKSYLWLALLPALLSSCSTLPTNIETIPEKTPEIVKPLPIEKVETPEVAPQIPELEQQTPLISKEEPTVVPEKVEEPKAVVKPQVQVPKKVMNPAFANFIKGNNLKYANVSFYAVNLKTGKVIENYKSQGALTPASVMKIVTSATALDVLHPDGKLQTKLLYDGTITNGNLQGNLYIQGGGDPTLGSDGISKDQTQFLRDWVSAVKAKGIKSISGNIIVLDGMFGYEGIPDTWLWEDMGTAYAPGVYGVSVFDNLYSIYLKTGAIGTKPQVIKTVPKIPGLKLQNLSTVSPRGRRDISVRGVPLDNNRVILGELPGNKEKIVIKSDIPNPGLFLGEYFSQYLKNSGVTLRGKVETSRTTSRRPRGGKVLAVTNSAPISEIVDVLLTRSDNHYTETLYQLLEKTKGIDIKEYWKDRGVDVGALTMKDGSGLSRGDTLSAKLLVDILQYMHNEHPDYDFDKLLPTAGREGTVSEFLRGTPLAGRSHIKSGSMSGIQSYAGYINKNGNEYAFALVVNHWNGTRGKLRKDMENMLNKMF